MSKERKQNLETGKQKRCRIDANSYANGIVFMPCIYGCRIGISVTRRENGAINTKTYLNKSLQEIIADDKEIKVISMYVPGNIVLFLGIVCILIFYSMNKNFILLLSLISLWIAVPKMFLLFSLIYQMKVSKSLESMGRYHAAEHKAINAYKKLGRAPKNIKELDKFSRFCKNCGVKYNFLSAIPEVLFSITLVFLQDVPKSLLMTAIISSILIWLICSGKLRFLQVFITEKPGEKELEVALHGIRTVEEFESSARFKKVNGENFVYFDYPFDEV